MASPARKLLMAGRGGLEPDPYRRFFRFCSPAMARRRSELKPVSRSLRAASVARLVRRPWTGNLRRHQRPGLPASVKSVAACCAPGCGGSPRLGVQMRLRHEFRGFSDQARRCSTRRRARCRSRPMFSFWRSAAPRGRASAPTEAGSRLKAEAGCLNPLRPANCGVLIGWSRLFREKIPRPAAEKHRLALQGPQGEGNLRGWFVARRWSPAAGWRAARSMPCRARSARLIAAGGDAGIVSRSAARRHGGASGAKTGAAARKTERVQFPAQSRRV